tara:strand:- start:191 stop:457 length:267 start_codon:yes stop_codon:yes gene_type:complete
MSNESENEKERTPPWTMTTIGEVIETMNKLKEEYDYSDETPIVWNHLENYNLTGQVVESHLVYDEWVEITFKEEGSDEGGRDGRKGNS